MRGQWLVVAAVVMFLQGCAALLPTDVPMRHAAAVKLKNCHGVPDCAVTITVTCPGGTCEAQADADVVVANKKPLQFTMGNAPGQSYKFDPDDGIRFKTVEGRKAFQCKLLGNGAFHCKGDGTGNGYEYSIHLTGTPEVPVVDPWVVNN